MDQASRLRALVSDKKEYPAERPQPVTKETPAAPPPLPLAENLQKLRDQKSAFRPLGKERRKNLADELPLTKENSRESDFSPPSRPAFSGARIIAVTSGKGGVGKTNLTVNLAIALKELGQRVIVIDADMGMANVDIILGTTSRKNLLSLLDDGVSFDDIIVHGPHGVDYISGGSGFEYVANFSPAEKTRLWEKLIVCDEMADIIILDTGAGLGKTVMDFILAADEVILITTPEPTALTDAYALLKAYSRFSPHKAMKLVVNRVYDEADCLDVVNKLSRTAERFLQTSLEYAGCIYEDKNVQKAVRKQTPLLAFGGKTIAARCIRSIANNLLSGKNVAVKRGWRELMGRFLGVFPNLLL